MHGMPDGDNVSDKVCIRGVDYAQSDNADELSVGHKNKFFAQITMRTEKRTVSAP